MKTFERIIIVGLCGLVLWVVFSSAFLTHASGSTSWGGFPVSDEVELQDYLAKHGFTSVSATNQHGLIMERFCGRYKSSRPFFVTVTAQATNAFGIYVGTDYQFSGFTRSVDDSSAKADEFEKLLHQWLEDHRMRKLNVQS